MSSLRSFRYDPLPKSSSIRVLELYTEPGQIETSVDSYDHFDPNDVIKCKLVTIDIKDDITYDALSYTWGDPLGVYHSKADAEQAAKMHKAKVPIICNDHILEIGVSLHDALLMLRMHRRSPSHTLRDIHPDFEPRKLVQEYIWIDAVCINQTSIPERNHQVQMMDKIYCGADAVLIWLGPGDNFCRSAAQALTVLARTPIEKAKNFSLSEGLYSEDHAASDAPAIGPGQWLCIYAFLMRRWFERAWIVQETALARIGIVFCGTIVLPWAALVRAIFWIRQSKCYPRIQKAGMTACTEIFSDKSGMYRPPELNDGIDAPAMIFAIADVRGGLKLPDIGMLIKSSATPIAPLNLLSRFRHCACLDRRDKVYAFMSLWPERFEQAESGRIVDYNKPVAEVYTDFARSVLCSSSNLRLLSHVDSRVQIEDLPSWVPDWSQSGSLKPFDTQIWLAESRHHKDGENPFNAAGDGDGEQDVPLILKPTAKYLAVQGIKVGVVETTARFDSDDLTTILPILSNMPVIYPCFRLSTLEEDDPLVGSTPASMPESLLNTMKHLTLNERDSQLKSSGAGTQDTTSERQKVISQNQKVVDIYQQTRFEALWRTIIADVWNFEHPAPRQGGVAFIASLVNNMHTLLSRGQRLLNRETMIHPHGAHGLVLDMMNAVIEGTGTSFEDIDAAWRKRMSILIALSEDEKMCLSHYAGDSFEEPERFIPDITTSEDILNYEYDVKIAQNWEVHIRPHRLLFTTSTHKVGLAPLTTKPRDEVWVLKGGKFPFILRRLENGHHILIGEAYVHGIMHGEVRWFGGQEFEDLTLE